MVRFAPGSERNLGLRYRFADCVLDTDRRELRRQGSLVAVEPQVFDLLVHLIRQRERVVGKDDIMAAVWHGRIVSESPWPTASTRRGVSLEIQATSSD